MELDHHPLLSEKACRALELIKYCKSVDHKTVDVLDRGRKEATKILEEFNQVFQGYGKLPDIIDLEIDKEVRPVITKPRRIPHAYRDSLKTELDEMEKNGLIRKEEGHSDWVSNILLVCRKEKIRICLDPTYLNKALKRPHYPFNTLDEVLAEIGGAQVFSVVDLKKGFMQIELTEKSSKLTTFWTPYGKYRFLRLCFGLTSSPEYFQMVLYRHLNDLEGIEVLADDILIVGKGETLEEGITSHNKNLRKLLERLQGINCKLNPEKAVICEQEVKFYGNIISVQGLKPDPKKVTAIKEMPAPKDKKDLERFLGMLNYQSRFISNASMECAQLRSLTHKDATWKWTDNEQKEFDRVKGIMSDQKTLKFFEVGVPVEIEADASCQGLGAVIRQNGRDIAFASRTLTSAEKNYAQIEKELLAIVFACKRFEQYIVGNNATANTDHKSLVRIFEKSILDVPKRLQTMMIFLHHYQLNLRYVPGKKLIVADTLSRAPINSAEDDPNEIGNDSAIPYYKNIASIKLVDHVKITDNRMNEIREATNQDSSLQMLSKYITEGWPDSIHKVSDPVKMYHKFKDELALEEGIIYRSGRILIPQKLRRFIIDRLHLQHSGIENTINLAYQNVFWPGMRAEITERVQNCNVCLTNSDNQSKEEMQSVKIPDYPFQIISMDVMKTEYNGKKSNFLITVDHYSDYFEIDKLDDLTPQSTIEICKKNFTTHGIPEEVISDNATNFDCREFREFAKKWEFSHITSSPHHPRGNGKAEATVKTAKKLIAKSEQDGTDFMIALLQHRNTPNKIEFSPVQRIFSRRTRCLIPTKLDNLKPKVAVEVKEKIEAHRKNSKLHYDRSTKRLPEITTGQPVVFKQNPETQKDWSLGSIQKQLTDRSFIINSSGKEYRRNREHIKPRSIQGELDAGWSNIADALEKSLVKAPTTSDGKSQEINPTQETQATVQPKVKEKNLEVPKASQHPINSRPKRNRVLPAHLRDDFIIDITS